MARGTAGQPLFEERGRPRRWTAITLACALVAAAVVVGSAAGANEHKSVRVDIDPEEAAAGQSVEVTTALTNESGQQQLGSANITAPLGFIVTSAAQPTVNGVTQGTAEIHNGVVELRDLSAPPHAVVTVTLTATTPCDAGDYLWHVQAKQANNFNGPPGNDFTVHPDSDLTLTVTGGCGVALRFVQGRQPADAERDAFITSVLGDPAGASVQVEVVDAQGNRVTNATHAITMAIDPDANPTGATLAGTVTRTAASGVATFPDLSIGAVGGPYRLHASSPGLSPVSSTAFSIWNDIATCVSGGTCTAGAAESGVMDVSSSGTGGADGGTVLLRLNAFEGVPDCGDTFNHAPLVTTLDSKGLGGTKTATMTIDRREVQKNRPNDGAAHYQVCFLADYGFTDRNGHPVPAGTEGLLPDCAPASPAPPCVSSRSKTGRGDVVVGLLLPAGPEADPVFR